MAGIAAGVAACGGGSGTHARGTTAPTTTAATTANPPSPSISVIAESPYASPTDKTPEEKVNALAEQHGWTIDDPEYTSPANWVQVICDSLPDQADSGPAQWLAENQATEPGQMDLLKAGVPLLCPKWTKTVRQAASGTYPVFVGDGTYHVTSKRGEENIPPGTYRTKGDLQDCYWERTAADGNIIDNRFATAASSITVTIRASDDTFTTRDCGTWQQLR